MNRTTASLLSRRDVIRAGLVGGAALAVAPPLAISAQPSSQTSTGGGGAPILKAIPSSGEKIPVIGLGTNAYGVTDAAEVASRKEVLQHMSSLGGRVIDTAHQYGRSEEVIGELLAALGNRKSYFLATKTPMGEIADAKAAIEESFRRLRTDHIELLQVHNMNAADKQLPAFRDFKKAGKIRYLGVTTSQDGHYEEMLRVMRANELDFIQVDYSLGNRSAEEQILPLAQERGVAVIANVPLGGRRGSMMSSLAGKPLPPWASEIGATSWAQLALKYVVSHPAVTCTIPGTTKLKHAEDNQLAGRGALPDAAMRKKMEQYWDSLPA
ncbi:MAG TPA: aldo/keto reductase [Steroidobacteraceae bacterium]|nr:aldo/keto reductase [Steroidobacteraceae bacterium]